MPTEVAELETSLPPVVYEIAAEVGEPFIEEAACSLWQRKSRASSPLQAARVEPWDHACCCCAEDESDEGAATCDELLEQPARPAPLIVVIAPLLGDEWTDRPTIEELLFGVPAKRRRWGHRPLQPVWIC